jgi:hypothetical protein
MDRLKSFHFTGRAIGFLDSNGRAPSPAPEHLLPRAEVMEMPGYVTEKK